MRRASVMKECGLMVKHAAKEFICIRMGQDMWVIFLQIPNTVAADKNGLTGPSTKANSTMVKNMDRAFLAGRMVTPTKAPSTIIRLVAKGGILGVMVAFIKVPG